jgi:hypothetical protein
VAADFALTYDRTLVDNECSTGAVDLGCGSARALTDDRAWCPSSAPGINATVLQDDVIERAVTA